MWSATKKENICPNLGPWTVWDVMWREWLFLVPGFEFSIRGTFSNHFVNVISHSWPIHGSPSTGLTLFDAKKGLIHFLEYFSSHRKRYYNSLTFKN